MQNQLLLIEDVDNLGRSGDVVSTKPGYARNFLLPQKKALIADKFTLRMQAKLKEERAKRAVVDRKEAEELAQQIVGKEFSIVVKVDPDGRMYGSVSSQDIVKMLSDQGFVVERKSVVLTHPIKQLGVHSIQLKLKEGVPANISLSIVSDKPLAVKKAVEETTPSEG